MHFPGFAGFQDKTDSGAGSLPDEMMVQTTTASSEGIGA